MSKIKVPSNIQNRAWCCKEDMFWRFSCEPDRLEVPPHRPKRSTPSSETWYVRTDLTTWWATCLVIYTWLTRYITPTECFTSHHVGCNVMFYLNQMTCPLNWFHRSDETVDSYLKQSKLECSDNDWCYILHFKIPPLKLFLDSRQRRRSLPALSEKRPFLD